MCYCCGKEIDTAGFCQWLGEPFSVRSTKEICFYCLSTFRPIIIPPGVAIVGTSSGDIYSLEEMLEDGFNEIRAIASIKSVGKALDIPPNIMKLRLKKPVRKKPASKT